MTRIKVISPPTVAGLLPIVALVAAVAVIGGCGEKDQIERYTVEKPPVGEPASQPDAARDTPSSVPPTAETQPAEASAKVRLLGAIVARPSRTWFFKATGPAEAMAAHAEDFAKFVESIRFEDDTPKWDLMEGWREEAGGGMRLATIKLGEAGDAPEISVIPLAYRGDDAEGYLLENVNRWRRQVGLKNITAGQLADEIKRIELDGDAAILVDLTGTPAPDGAHPMGMGRPRGDVNGG